MGKKKIKILLVAKYYDAYIYIFIYNCLYNSRKPGEGGEWGCAGPGGILGLLVQPTRRGMVNTVLTHAKRAA